MKSYSTQTALSTAHTPATATDVANLLP